ncbi:interleukin-18-like [Ambystoma mexicanum]|uniref:interleukin-18-like n=1 Tax=Ambystoma mexicanum TaxID=8296 RepID=UPI0037E94BDD
MDPNHCSDEAAESGDGKWPLRDFSTLFNRAAHELSPSTDVPMNSWMQISTRKVAIKGICGKILFAKPAISVLDSRAFFITPNIPDYFPEDAIFNVTTYKDTLTHVGVSVTFNVNINNSSYMVFSNERNGLLRLKPGDIPTSIPKSPSELVFFQNQFSEHGLDFKFESSLFPGSYWSLKDEDDTSASDLYLNVYSCPANVPETCKIKYIDLK